MLVADGMHRAVFGTRAIPFRLATIHVRIAYMIWRTSTHRIVRWIGNTERGWMTRIRMACFHGDTFDVGHRIRAKPGWALADRFVVVRNADRVHAARVFVAGVIAGVCESVTELRWRTVDVVDAGNRTTPGCRVIRITGVLPRWTFAVRHVIVDNAERVGTAGDEVANQLASEGTVWSAATRLILRALAVRGATILAWTVTAPTIVWIAGVAW